MDCWNTYETEERFSFARHASIGCGGYAKMAVFPKNQEELVAVVTQLKDKGTPYCVVGKLTNTLPPDGETDTVIVSTLRIKSTDGKFFSSGLTGAELLAYCRKNGLCGAEFLYGIPCSFGGVLFMNAGVGGAYISDIVESVRVLRNGKVADIPVKECEYGYKTSVFMQNGDCILGANLRLLPESERMITELIAHYKERRVHLPKGKSMGCVFKNPENGVAGKLIEGAGLKGFRVGGAVVSEMHANFIINDRGATSMQIKCLIDVIKSAVYAQYKIRLQEEIRYLT